MQLKDICCAQSSNIALKDLKHNSGPYPIYGASGFITCVDFFKVDKPYVGVVKDGAGVGRVMLLPEKSSVIGTMQSIIPTAGTDAKYLSYLLDFLDLGRFCSGATIPHIYFKDYGKETIPTHSPEQQQEISAALDKITKLIALRQGQLAKLDQLAKSRFIEMFGDPVTNPMCWSQKTMKEMALRLSDGPFGSNLKSEHYANDGIRVIRLQNIGVNKFVDNDRAFVSLQHYETIKKYTCRGGDIVIGTLGEPNLRACLIPNYIHVAINKADCVHYVPNDIFLNKIFVCFYLNIPATLSLASGMIHGQTRSRISSGQIAKLPIILPPLSLQNEFAAFIEQLDKSSIFIRSS